MASNTSDHLNYAEEDVWATPNPVDERQRRLDHVAAYLEDFGQVLKEKYGPGGAEARDALQKKVDTQEDPRETIVLHLL